MVFVGFEPTSTSNGNRICSIENWMTCVSSWCFFFNQLYKMTRFSLWMWNWMMPTSKIISKLDFGRIVCYIYVHFTHVYSYHILLGLFLLCKTPIHKFLSVSTYCHPPRNLSKLILTISPGFFRWVEVLLPQLKTKALKMPAKAWKAGNFGKFGRLFFTKIFWESSFKRRLDKMFIHWFITNDSSPIIYRHLHLWTNQRKKRLTLLCWELPVVGVFWELRFTTCRWCGCWKRSCNGLVDLRLESSELK